MHSRVFTLQVTASFISLRKR